REQRLLVLTLLQRPAVARDGGDPESQYVQSHVVRDHPVLGKELQLPGEQVVVRRLAIACREPRVLRVVVRTRMKEILCRVDEVLVVDGDGVLRLPLLLVEVI